MSEDQYGFVYLWRDKEKNRYYVGSHWGREDDGYVCSSSWMKSSYKNRRSDFKRRILQRVFSSKRHLRLIEQKWLLMIKPEELGKRYYNLIRKTDHLWYDDPEKAKLVGKKISLSHRGKKSKMSPEQLEARGRKISEVKRRNAEKRLLETGERLTPGQRDLAARAGSWSRGRVEASEERARRSESFRRTAAAERSCCLSCRKEVATMHLAQHRCPPPRVARGARLRDLWADAEWRARQQKRLSEGAVTRPPRSEESKRKTREAQHGKPKRRESTLSACWSAVA